MVVRLGIALPAAPPSCVVTCPPRSPVGRGPSVLRFLFDFDGDYLAALRVRDCDWTWRVCPPPALRGPPGVQMASPAPLTPPIRRLASAGFPDSESLLITGTASRNGACFVLQARQRSSCFKFSPSHPATPRPGLALSSMPASPNPVFSTKEWSQAKLFVCFMTVCTLIPKFFGVGGGSR